MNEKDAKKIVWENHCPTCGGQRCYGQDDWIDGCTVYQKLLKEKDGKEEEM